MECCNHPGKEAGGICVHCGRLLCPDCILRVGGKNYCRDCVKEPIEPGSVSSPQPHSQQQQPRPPGFFTRHKGIITAARPGLFAAGLFIFSFIIVLLSGTSLYIIGLGFILMAASVIIGAWFVTRFLIRIVRGKKREKTGR